MQEHKPALAEQQLCPRLLFLFVAITPTLVSGKLAPVSLAVQTMALIQKQTSIKREHYSAVTATSPQPFQFPDGNWGIGKQQGQERWVCVSLWEAALLELRFST